MQITPNMVTQEMGIEFPFNIPRRQLEVDVAQLSS